MASGLIDTSRDVRWSELMIEALNVPGSLGNTYSRFYPYSMGNMLLMRLQGLNEPVATYKRWLELGRQVKKGSKAKAILRPVTVTARDVREGEEPKKFTRFKLVKCIFGLSDTEGEELPPYEPPTWNRERALGKLAIAQVPFEHLDGNAQGYSYERNVAVSPVAVHPVKTLMHEVAHIEHGHTTGDQVAEYLAHRGLKEFEAEGSAFLVMTELDAPDQWDRDESRAYIQHWLGDSIPPERSIRGVFKVADTILRAGREEIAT